MNPGAYVLIIEDDIDLSTVVREILELEGYTITSAENGREALDFLTQAKSSPCLILLDIMMPVMDGREFLKHARETWPTIGTIPPVVVMSAIADRSLLHLDGINQVVQKPIPIEKLIAIVKTICP